MPEAIHIITSGRALPFIAHLVHLRQFNYTIRRSQIALGSIECLCCEANASLRREWCAKWRKKKEFATATRGYVDQIALERQKTEIRSSFGVL